MYTTSGKTLRQHRVLLKLSQARLAEISKVSQHIISAFELEKITLAPYDAALIDNALNSKNIVENIIKRAKRYKEHTYKKAVRLPERIAKTSKTRTNDNYLNDLQKLSKDNRTLESKKYSAISLFSGCGGFSLGAAAAGFDIKGFVELDDGLRGIYKKNFPQSNEIGTDISKITDSDIKKAYDKIGDIDLIIGGPPCQGFSLSGKRDVNDPRNSLFKDYLRFVDKFKPKIALLENVRLLSSMKNSNGGLVKNDITNEFLKYGYVINFFNIDAADYGVPQHRDRVIFVAIRKDIKTDPSIPEPQYSNSDLFSAAGIPRTFGDATSDLDYLETGEQSESDPMHAAVNHPSHVIEWLWDVPEGSSAHDNKDSTLRPPSGYNTTYKRQIWNEPASTVQTTFGMISGCRNVHPVATRSLTIREAARIQSFPDDYIFEGNLGTIRTGIGNAVPPLLAYYLAKHAASTLIKAKSCRNSQPQD